MPATVELLARCAPLPHQVALDWVHRLPHDIAVNATVLTGGSLAERVELWQALLDVRAGSALTSVEARIAGFCAPVVTLERLLAAAVPFEALLGGEGPVSGAAVADFDVAQMLVGAAHAARIPASCGVWEQLCARVRAAYHAVPSAECGKVAASPGAPGWVRARVLEVAPVEFRVGAVLCAGTKLSVDAAAEVVWPSSAVMPPGDVEGYLALASLARCERQVAARVAERLVGMENWSTVQRVAALCALGVWVCAPQLVDRLVSEAEALLALVPLPQSWSDPAARMVATTVHAMAPAGPWRPVPALRVALEGWLGGHPSRGKLLAATYVTESRWESLDDGRLAGWQRAGRPAGEVAAVFGVAWDPEGLGAEPVGFEVPPEGFEEAAVALGGSEDAWRFALELADGTLSCSELFDLAATIS